MKIIKLRQQLFSVMFLMPLLVAESAYAGKQEGIDAYHHQEYTIAYRELLPAAQNGDADAQYILGRMYELGQGRDVDYKKAIVWLRRSAKKGNDQAQYLLGNLYVNGGNIVSVDYRKALGWYLKSAASGNADASYGIGYMYEKGMGVKTDSAEAYKWFTIAMLGGNKSAEKHRAEIEPTLSPESIAQSNALAKKQLGHKL